MKFLTATWIPKKVFDMATSCSKRGVRRLSARPAAGAPEGATAPGADAGDGAGRPRGANRHAAEAGRFLLADARPPSQGARRKDRRAQGGPVSGPGGNVRRPHRRPLRLTFGAVQP